MKALYLLDNDYAKLKDAVIDKIEAAGIEAAKEQGYETPAALDCGVISQAEMDDIAVRVLSNSNIWPDECQVV